jgi:hypothetical protein
MAEEKQFEKRRPDFTGYIKLALWVNGDSCSLHIGDLKLKLEKNK